MDLNNSDNLDPVSFSNTSIHFLEIKFPFDEELIFYPLSILIKFLKIILNTNMVAIVNFISSASNDCLIQAIGKFIIALNENDLALEKIFIKISPSPKNIDNFLINLKNLIVPAIPGILVRI